MKVKALDHRKEAIRARHREVSTCQLGQIISEVMNAKEDHGKAAASFRNLKNPFGSPKQATTFGGGS